MKRPMNRPGDRKNGPYGFPWEVCMCDQCRKRPRRAAKHRFARLLRR